MNERPVSNQQLIRLFRLLRDGRIHVSSALVIYLIIEKEGGDPYHIAENRLLLDIGD